MDSAIYCYERGRPIDTIIERPEEFEHNQSFIAVAESKKPPERTKYIAIKHHHFKSLVDNKVIRINYINKKK